MLYEFKFFTQIKKVNKSKIENNDFKFTSSKKIISSLED